MNIFPKKKKIEVKPIKRIQQNTEPLINLFACPNILKPDPYRVLSINTN
jgi:hypothetical protein